MTSIKEDVRAALEWTAAVLQAQAYPSGTLSERSIFTVKGVRKTLAEILDMADAALAAQQQEGEPVLYSLRFSGPDGFRASICGTQSFDTMADAEQYLGRVAAMAKMGWKRPQIVPLYTRPQPASAEREARWMAASRAAVTDAIDLLTLDADALRDCSTHFDGTDYDWTGEPDAKVDYERMIRTVEALRAALKEQE